MVNTIRFPNLGLEFHINRVAVTIFGQHIYWYAVIITLGICLAFIYVVLEGKRQGIKADIFTDAMIIGLPASIIGARAYYVFSKWDYYSQNLWEIINIRNGGLAIYGALIASITAVCIYLSIKKINILKVFDIFSVGLLIGQAVGRWGNFVNVEAYGYKTESFFKMEIFAREYNEIVTVHPTFLYESAWNILWAVILAFLMGKKTADGQIFFGYIIAYGVGRFFIEGLRTDSLMFFDFRISQIVAVLSVIAGVVAFIYVTKRKRRR